MFEFACSSCGKRMRAPEAMRGKKARCSVRLTVVVVPAIAAASESSELIAVDFDLLEVPNADARSEAFEAAIGSGLPVEDPLPGPAIPAKTFRIGNLTGDDLLPSSTAIPDDDDDMPRILGLDEHLKGATPTATPRGGVALPVVYPPPMFSRNTAIEPPRPNRAARTAPQPPPLERPRRTRKRDDRDDDYDRSPSRGSGAALANASVIVGIVNTIGALSCGWLFCGMSVVLNLPLGVVGIGLAMSARRAPKSTVQAGIVLNAVAVAIPLVMLAFVAFGFAAFGMRSRPGFR